MRLRLAGLTLALAAPATASDLTTDEIKQLALEAIRENPEIVMEAMAILRSRDERAATEAAAEVLSEQRVMLENDPNAPVLDNPDGDVTVIEVFDWEMMRLTGPGGETVSRMVHGQADYPAGVAG